MGADNSKMGNYKRYESVYEIIFWIDADLNSKENIANHKHFKEKLEKLGGYQLQLFKSTKDFYNFIKTKSVKFKIIFVVISGGLYADFYTELKNLKNSTTNIFLSIIFTSPTFKKILLKEQPNTYNIKQEILDSIKDSYYNFGGVTSKKDDIVNFVRSFLGFKYDAKANYDGALTFEIIENTNFERLIFPALYGSIQMQDNVIDEEDIIEFNNLLIKRHDYTKKGISELITLYSKIGKIPLEIIAKYWIRYYSSESSFYTLMNSQFMKNNYEDYEPFVKILYKGIEKGFLQSKNDEVLYRCQSISKKEFDQITSSIKNNKKIQVYSRAFLSFSLNEKKSHEFLKKETDDLIPIKFILKPKNEGEIFASNADIRQYSIYNEEEVLFFPFSSFIIEDNIREEKIKDINARIIYLNYLGQYEKEIKLKISETLDKNISMEEIIGVDKDWKFSKDILNKTMKEKHMKNIGLYEILAKDAMKNVLKSKTKKSIIKDEIKYSTPYH